MRTSQDVYNQIRWDPRFEPGLYKLGVLTRHHGVVEINLLDFVPGGDIPWHRVHYIEGPEGKVWDRGGGYELKIPERAEKDALDVLSWNCRYEVRGVVDFLRQHPSDLIGLQEVHGELLEALYTLPYHVFSGSECALLSRESAERVQTTEFGVIADFQDYRVAVAELDSAADWRGLQRQLRAPWLMLSELPDRPPRGPYLSTGGVVCDLHWEIAGSRVAPQANHKPLLARVRRKNLQLSDDSSLAIVGPRGESRLDVCRPFYAEAEHLEPLLRDLQPFSSDDSVQLRELRRLLGFPAREMGALERFEVRCLYWLREGRPHALFHLDRQKQFAAEVEELQPCVVVGSALVRPDTPELDVVSWIDPDLLPSDYRPAGRVFRAVKGSRTIEVSLDDRSAVQDWAILLDLLNRRFLEDDFRALLDEVKGWATARQIYGQRYGYPGGLAWAVMVAAFLLDAEESGGGGTFSGGLGASAGGLAPSAAGGFAPSAAGGFSASAGRLNSFQHYWARWEWPRPVRLTELEWEGDDPMTVLSPAQPPRNATRTVTPSTLQCIVAEFQQPRTGVLRPSGSTLLVQAQTDRPDELEGRILALLRELPAGYRPFRAERAGAEWRWVLQLPKQYPDREAFLAAAERFPECHVSLA